MPVQLFQATTNNFVDTEIDANALLRSVQFAVSAPYSAKYQIAKKSMAGEPAWDGNELIAQPGQGGFQENIYGIRFKSFDPAHPTTVLCKAFFQDDPVPTGDLASTSTFNTGGQVSPGGSSVEVDKNGVLVGTEPKLDFEDLGPFLWSITDDLVNSRIKISLGTKFLTGRINAAGGIVAGSGFTITKLGVGNYQINFTNVFPTVPLCIAIVDNSGTGLFTTCEIDNPSVNSIQILTYNLATAPPVLTDLALNFIIMIPG